MKDCKQLIRLLRFTGKIYIQTHDFPDHDSVASAFGLQRLLAAHDLPSRITYTGEIQRESLRSMIRTLGIEMNRSERYSICSRDRVIIVDGCKGNQNVLHLPAPELAVIDHHAVERPEDIAFFDVRARYGACSTIIYEYFRQLGTAISQPVATALLVGISMDTAQLRRGASPNDVDAYSGLHALADVPFVNSIVTSHIETRDLGFYRTAIERLRVDDGFAFCYLPEGCNENLMGIVADFFAGLGDVEFVTLCARNRGRVHFSVRSKRPDWNASLVLQDSLEGIGLGGGHRHMAGGSINDIELFDIADVYRRFRIRLGIVPDRSADPAGKEAVRIPVHTR